MSIVQVSNIYVEDLFKWFYDHVIESCGDGCGAIVCKNYSQAADWFVEWYKKEFDRKQFHRDKDEKENIINFHDSNENFIFTNKIIELGDKDYVFVVLDNCKAAFWKDRIVYPIERG